MIDEFDEPYFRSEEMMNKLSKLQVSGVTATASASNSDIQTELKVLEKFGFKVNNLFPNLDKLEAEDFT